ncbi:hypothetical protein B0H10DRAFT_1990083 [Mycena sp. CBHHK59/15]|nr:hypothetical protein B0H10DRAFT_2051901 [Mycena sp. CBHHK59/15]KAJ6628467.1 hypothetical protein B0H10DRAFT_1990083 [Mycena sp. CBHHK59/15]
MQRCLFYLLLLSGLSLYHCDWLTGPLLGAAMAVSVAIAFHAIVLRDVKSDGVTDLDGLVIFQILAISLYSSIPFIILSRTARRTPAYFILIMCWVCLCYTGMFCAIVAAHPTTLHPCAPYNSTAGITVGVNITECAAVCLQMMSPLREAGSAVPIPAHQLHAMDGGIAAAQIIGSCCGSLTLLIGIFRLSLVFAPSDDEAEEGEKGISKALTFGPPCTSIARGSIILGRSVAQVSGCPGSLLPPR